MAVDPTENPYPEAAGAHQHALDSVEQKIESWPDVPSEFKALVKAQSESFIYRTRETARQSTHFYGGQLGWTYWVIKNDDLNLIGQLGPAALAVVTFASVPAAPVAVMAFGLVMSMVGVAQKLRTKSVVLEPQDYQVLMMLKKTGPSTISELAENLSGLHIYGRDLWDEARTVAALERLKRLIQSDGSTTTLVNEGSEGRWSTSGI